MNRYFYFILVFFFLFPLTACAGKSITITVLDAETRDPIEGAVALSYWNKTEGIGLTYTKTIAVAEKISDINGKIKIPQVSTPLNAHPPQLKVYKFGYVGWSSKYIYLGHYENNLLAAKSKKRTDFKWKSQTIYLEKFKPEYSYVSHGEFLERERPTFKEYDALGGKLYFEAIDSEDKFRTKELDIYYKNK